MNSIVDEWIPFRSIPSGSVALYTSPWVSGAVADAYYGPVKAERFVPDDDGFDVDLWLAAEEDVMDDLKKRARELGANAVVGLEVQADPFFERDGKCGLCILAFGTAACLRELL